MSNEEVSQASNPSLWEKLVSIRQGETRNGNAPGWVIMGAVTYQVVQKVDGSIVFKPYSSENLYESTSF
jgi:hypothetical protein